MSWETVRLGDVAKFRYGKGLPQRLRNEDGKVPVVSSAGITGYHDQSFVNDPCVVVGRKGTIGAVYYLEEPCWPIDTAFYILESDELDLRFCSYLLETLPLKEMNSDSAVPGLNRTYAENLEVTIPEKGQQVEIVAVLRGIEEKIESNQRICNLVSDYVDSFLESTISECECQTIEIGRLVEFNKQSVKPFSSEELLYIDIAAVEKGEIKSIQKLSWHDAPSRARRKVEHGDVIFSTVRPGRQAFAQILEPVSNTVVSTGFAVMSPTEKIGTSMLTSIVGAKDFSGYLESVAQGSAYPAVSVSSIGSYLVTLPRSVTVINEFEEKTMPLRMKTSQLKRESKSLEQLRDTILPELLSGRLSPEDIPALVNNAEDAHA